MNSPRKQLGDLQLAIMRVLWRRAEAAVSEVYEDLLAERGLAPTTVATMLVKMEKKGVVRHRVEGRKFIYEPAVSEQEVTDSMVGQVTQRLFGGDVAAFASHLLARSEIDPAELRTLKALIEEREREES